MNYMDNFLYLQILFRVLIDPLLRHEVVGRDLYVDDGFLPSLGPLLYFLLGFKKGDGNHVLSLPVPSQLVQQHTVLEHGRGVCFLF